MYPEDAGSRFVEAQKRLVTQASDFSLGTISSMVSEGALNPDPDYQRRQRWDGHRQSALIESFLLNVPVPPVYLAEEDYGNYSVIDGKQRITAIHDFMQNRLSLSGLAELYDLNGLRFDQLPDMMSNALRVRPYIRAITLLRQTDPELKFEVFIRLNRGGESLNAQEVRHVAFRGPMNDMVLQLATDEFLLRQFNMTHDSKRYRQMQDAEYVLRFLTLREVWARFGGDLSAAMDSFMLENSHSSEDYLEDCRRAFNRSIEACQRIWGPAAFCRAEHGTWRGRAILGMYDAEMLAVDMLDDELIERVVNRQKDVISETARLFNNEDFYRAVTVSTNTSARLHLRVEWMRGLLYDIAGR